MKKTVHFFLTLIIILAALLPISAKEALFEGDYYNIKINYEDKSKPGDAVFVRMIVSQTDLQSKKNKINLSETKSQLELYLNEKRLDKTNFYELTEKRTAKKSNSVNSVTLLAGIPLSSWWSSKDSYSLKIVYTLSDKSKYDLSLPFVLEHKDFISETIQLDAKNTGIKTDTSTKRMEQINKLNAILGTVNSEHVYQTSPYIPPTKATRRTSYFADRRVYAYSDGKSSTSLHYGTDYGIPTGSKVTACAAGRVVMAEDRISTGWSVVIEHLPGLYSLYYHMSELKVHEGDIIESGTLIGLSGATGLATGPHLHWEMRLNMAAVNPDYFTTDFTCSSSK